MKSVFQSNLGNPVIYVFNVVPLAFFHTQHNVFGSGKQIHQFEMLMDHTDFQVKRILGRADDHFFSILENFPFIGKINPGNHIHQGRFSAAVLAQNGQNFPLIHIQIHAFVGHHAAKAFGDALHAQRQILFHGIPSVYCIKWKVLGTAAPEGAAAQARIFGPRPDHD